MLLPTCAPFAREHGKYVGSIFQENEFGSAGWDFDEMDETITTPGTHIRPLNKQRNPVGGLSSFGDGKTLTFVEKKITAAVGDKFPASRTCVPGWPCMKVLAP